MGVASSIRCTLPMWTSTTGVVGSSVCSWVCSVTPHFAYLVTIRLPRLVQMSILELLRDSESQTISKFIIFFLCQY